MAHACYWTHKFSRYAANIHPSRSKIRRRKKQKKNNKKALVYAAELVDASAGLLDKHDGHSSVNPAETVDASATSIFGADDEKDGVNQTTGTSTLTSKAEIHPENQMNQVQSHAARAS